MMITLNYTLRFTSPAFLGGADQSGQWRTPPIKALLRQCWRMAWAEHKQWQGSVDDMRRAEAALFGSATDANGSSQSLVRLRLNHWAEGKLKGWEGLEAPKIDHEEAEKVGKKVGPHSYLGYGPLDGRHGTTFSTKINAAIQAGEYATLSLAFPEANEALLMRALTLMNAWGTLGGRSRNGWGSFVLEALDTTPALALTELPSRPWADAVQQDWAHALGSDKRGALVWQTDVFADWKQAMRRLAEIKIAVRTQFKFTTGKSAPRTEDRHWLSYPVTNHSVAAWGGNARLPNSLRFKLRPDEQDPSKLRGIIFHMPCQPPQSFRPDPAAIRKVWQQVHASLDGMSMQRTPG